MYAENYQSRETRISRTTPPLKKKKRYKLLLVRKNASCGTQVTKIQQVQSLKMDHLCYQNFQLAFLLSHDMSFHQIGPILRY